MKIKEELKKVEEKYLQLRNPYIKYIEQEKNEKQLEGILEINEKKQLEKWTNKKCGEILFDSDKDDWNENTSVFDDRLMNKSNLIFIVEDTNGNKFGGYITSKIEKYDSYINDEKAFVFSLKSNNRLKRMKKFHIAEPKYAFLLFQKSNQYDLFRIGRNDIGVYKMNRFNGGTVIHHTFDYKGYKDILRIDGDFTMKRFIVIQMK